MSVKFDPNLPLSVKITSNGLSGGAYIFLLWEGTTKIMRQSGDLHDGLPDEYSLPYSGGSSASNQGRIVDVSIIDPVESVGFNYHAELIVLQNGVAIATEPYNVEADQLLVGCRISIFL